LGGALDLDGAPSPSPLAELQGMQDEDEAEPGPEGEGEEESATPALSDQQEQPARDFLSGHLLYCKVRPPLLPSWMAPNVMLGGRARQLGSRNCEPASSLPA
jgi:hypothetical protein